MSDMNARTKEELERVVSKVSEEIQRAEKPSQYSKVIRREVLENKDLLSYFKELKESKLKEIFANYFKIKEEFIAKVAHNTRDWFKKNQEVVNNKLKELNLVENVVESTVIAEHIEPNEKAILDLSEEDKKSKDENMQISKTEITKVATDVQNVVSLSNDVVEEISNLKEQIKEKDIELSSRANEIEGLKLKLSEIEKKINQTSPEENYQTLFDISSVYKLKDRLGKDYQQVEIDIVILDAIAEFVKRYGLLDVTNFTRNVQLSPSAKMVEAAFIAILKKNEFLKL